jgi:hypothetical protein
MRTCLVASGLLAVSLALGQHWAGPFQLTNDTFADVNPSACPEWVAGWNTYLVWQTNRNGNWDIYAKFCTMMGGNGWGADESVSTDSADDLNPAVAACNDQLTDHPSFWCVWERRESSIVGSIWASFITFREDWQAPTMVGRYIHTGGDSAEPRVIVIRNNEVDTTWVTWTCHDTDGWRIEYAYHAGDSWYGPWSAVTSADPIRHARLGRGHHDRYYGCPLLAWESGGNIFYAEYLDGSWSAPQEVAHSEALDRNPDILSYSPYPFDGGPWITWESARDGDMAVYGTAMDTFSVGRRWCDSTGGGNNYAPCGTPAAYTVDFWEDAAVAWVTDRNGNPDIYSRTTFSDSDDYVDRDSADDVNPTLTTLGLTEHWCVWQSNRSGNWDLYGSFIYVVGVEECPAPQAASRKPDATVVRGTLFLPRDMTELPGDSDRVPRPALLDVSGRRALGLHPGANDVSSLAPGVYFVSEAQAQAVRKVIIQR